MKYKQLWQVAKYQIDRITAAKVNDSNYISTENMLPDRGGIQHATIVPESRTFSKYINGDILLSNIRPYFKKIWFAYMTGGCSNDVLVVRPNDIDAKFLYYVLSDNNFFKYSTVTSKGTKMPRGSKTAIMKYLVPDVDPSSQTRIAETLSTYDNAIENNNCRIALLEKAAQELYKEWFVRFRFPGHECVKFVNGIPEGWVVKRLGEFCYVTDGTHDTPKQTDSGVPLITGKSINGGFIDFDSAYFISESDHKAISRRSGLESGDILLSNIGTVGSICVVNYDREFSVKNIIILKPKSSVKTAYLYYLMTSPVIQDVLSMQTNGASQQFVGLTFMRRFKILVPSEPVLERFAEQITPILLEKQTLHAKSQNLVRQRDMLLPRMMSGKLEV